MNTWASSAVTPDTEDRERRAYNRAFWQLGFRWQWDPATYRELARIPQENERIRAYLERHQPHLLKAYDIDFLCEMIRRRKDAPAGEIHAFSVNSGTLI